MTDAVTWEADPGLDALIDRALRGERVVLTREGVPMVRLVPVPKCEAPRIGGQWKGRVRIAPDFDELPPDIADAFGTPGR